MGMDVRGETSDMLCLGRSFLTDLSHPSSWDHTGDVSAQPKGLSGCQETALTYIGALREL